MTNKITKAEDRKNTGEAIFKGEQPKISQNLDMNPQME